MQALVPNPLRHVFDTIQLEHALAVEPDPRDHRGVDPAGGPARPGPHARDPRHLPGAAAPAAGRTAGPAPPAGRAAPATRHSNAPCSSPSTASPSASATPADHASAGDQDRTAETLTMRLAAPKPVDHATNFMIGARWGVGRSGQMGRAAPRARQEQPQAPPQQPPPEGPAAGRGAWSARPVRATVESSLTVSSWPCGHATGDGGGRQRSGHLKRVAAGAAPVVVARHGPQRASASRACRAPEPESRGRQDPSPRIDRLESGKCRPPRVRAAATLCRWRSAGSAMCGPEDGLGG